MAKIAKIHNFCYHAHSGPCWHREISSEIIFMPKFVIYRSIGSRCRGRGITFPFSSIFELSYHPYLPESVHLYL